MKNLFTISLTVFFTIFSFSAFATTYYLSSSSGNDNNSGTDAASPWRSIDKLNSFNNLRPGDYVLFKRGDTFYGGIRVNNSGSSGNPITFGAYGSGNKPIITGFTNVTSWTNLGGNIWESSNGVSSLPYTNMVSVNGVNTAMGRYPNSTGPNTGYLTIQSHSGDNAITAVGGLGSNNWSGAGILIRKQRYALERGTIVSQSGNTLNYTDPGIDTPQDGFGFFIQDDPKTLDVNGEWYYNPSDHKLRIYSTSTPQNVKIATVENLVLMNRNNYIVFDNLAFTGSNSDALSCGNYGTNLTVQNCDISFAGMSAIWCIMANALIQNNNITDANYAGIYTSEINATIQSNNITNINLFEGMDQGLISAGAIATVGANSVTKYNQINNCGYAGIKFSGLNTKVTNNFVNRFCLIKEDGGGIDMSSRDRAAGSVIDGNIVINGIGSKYGTSDTTLTDFGGIFIDAYGTGITISNNTVANCAAAGIKLHGANNIIVTNNTTYNNGGSSWTKGGLELISQPDYLIRDITVQGNIFVARTPEQWAFFGYPAGGDPNDALSFGTFNNNYYGKPIDPSSPILINHDTYTFAGWQSFSGSDANSYATPKNITDLNDLRFEYNASSSPKTISLDANYIDMKNVSYNGSITLKPWSSAVLIRNGASTANKNPVASVGADRNIQLPQNSIVLPGSGDDSDGTVVSYSWTQVDGPSTASLSDATSAEAGASELVQGRYVFRLTVTDNAGATGSADLNVTVQSLETAVAIPNIPPVPTVGSDRVVQLPKNSIVLPGSGTDSDGTIASYSWTQVSGPSTATLVNSTSAQAGAGDLIVGTYQFKLTVTDNQGATGTATVNVEVTNGDANIAPVANVGSDRVIQLPKNSVVLPGSAKDQDGTVVSYSWSQVSGPSTATLVNPTSAQGGAGDLVEGSYQFKLTVTDDQGASGSAILNVLVTSGAPNIPPVANVDKDRNIYLPKNSVILPGSGTDPDGSIVSYAWTQISGPSSATMVNPTSAQGGAGDLVVGPYQFQLTVTDNEGATGTATLNINVNTPGSGNLKVNGGSDRNIQLPKNSIVLPGSATDPDGTIISYQWTQISGPSTATLVNPTSAQGGAGDLIAGVYQFKLTAVDDQGATASAVVNVTVTGGNQARMMNVQDATSTNTGDTASVLSNSTLATIGNSTDLVKSPTSGITDQAAALSIFPNPAHDFINLQFTASNISPDAEVVITDINGKTVYKSALGTTTSSVKQINVSQLKAGTYIVTVAFNGTEIKSTKFIKM
ncbi:T9SS C-terminal target domain-containing protein [Hanamia caeni]|jgi:hypothetical protein|uniref:T9SS C-terminal target domain-containing protein n=1 Tax=Hanamia caeni TaxID=2294116 RepID=A0A3M9N7K0_9BACT|nr:T9SS type A sorting domain-containing protein [Hanamia caeni]RNI33355.1 T9SS C-terminal target domain-containing protein [Hanamia caeni]